MPLLLLEPPAVAAHAHGPGLRPRPSSFDDLTSQAPALRRTADARSAFAAAGLAAAAIGALGWDGGLLWLVAGVWAVRAAAGTPPGLAWGIACVGAGMRWGTLGLGDLEVATRIAGPTLLAGPALVRAGMFLALGAAIVSEGRSEPFASRTWGERAAAATVAASLGPLFVVSGPSWPVGTDVLAWAASAIAATTLILFGRPLFARTPEWATPLAAATGVAMTMLAS